jgi:iron complex outermembrane receptor protein
MCIASACASATAFAQDRAAQPDSTLERIVITGRPLEFKADVSGRLGLSERETPAAIDLLTQEDLQNEGIRSAVEAMNAAPGVVSGNLPGSVGSVSMRGFHRAVNYLYDGVRIANSGAEVRNWDAWSFERIEVIKGPASVTSGEGALAGAINFVPRRPVIGDLFGEVLASYDSLDGMRLAGDLNVPLGGKAATRGDLSYSRADGYIEDTDSQAFAGTFSTLFLPSDQFSVTLSADYFEDNFATAYYGTPLVPASVARDPADFISGSAGLVFDKAIRGRNYDTEDGRMNSDSLWLRARVVYQASDTWQFVSDTSWYTADRLWRDSDDYSFNAASRRFDRLTSLITHDHQVWNQRLHGVFDGDLAGRRNRFTLGAEISGTDFFTVRRFGTAPSVDPWAPIRGLFAEDTPANFSTRQNVAADVTSKSVFIEDAFNVTPEFLVVGGARLDDFKFDRQVVNVTSGAASTYGQSYDPVSWRLGSVYSLTPSAQLYAQYTRAATPVSGLLFMSAANAAFKVSMGESYEAGLKTSLAQNRVQLTASVFHIRQDDILTRDPANPAVTIQGGSQISKGAEMALDWSLTDELRVEIGASVLNAAFDRLIEAGGADRSGNRPPNVPERLADIVVTYTPQSLPVTFTGAVRHNGDFFTSNDNSVNVAAFTTFEAAVSWTAPFATVTVRGRNLTDKLYADWSGYAPYLVFEGAPRSVEITLSRRF